MIAAADIETEILVDIGECALDTDADIALSGARAILNDDERARASSFVFARDAERFVRGRGYLRTRLGAWLGMAPRHVPIAAGRHGKPYVEGHGVRFNLSNCGALAVLAIAEDVEVGIDLEGVDGADSFEAELAGLADLCLNDEEQAALAAAPREGRVRRFLSYWTAKEALMKLTGEGFALDPLDIALQLSDGRPVGYRRPNLPEADLRFVRLSHPDAVCCLATGRYQEKVFMRV